MPKHNRSNRSPAGAGSAEPEVDPDELSEAAAIAEGFPAPDPGKPPREINKPNLIRLVHAARDEQRRQQSARQRAEAELEQAQHERRAIEEEKRQLAADKAASNARILEQEEIILRRLEDQFSRMESLADTVQQLRLARDAIVDEQTTKALAVLDEFRERESTAIAIGAAGDREAARAQAEAIRAEARTEAAATLARAEEQARQVRERHVQQQAVLDALAAKLERQQSRLESRQQAFTRVERDIREELAAENADADRALQQRLTAAERDRDRLMALNEQVTEQLRAAQERERAMDGQSLAALQSQVGRLQQALAESEADRRSRPETSVVEERDAYEARLREAHKELAAVQAERLELRTQAAERHGLDLAVAELEQELKQREDSIGRAQRRIAELRAELAIYSDAGDAEPPDQDLTEIDVMSRQRSTDEVRWRRAPLDLAQLVSEAQARMAEAGRFYSQADVRLFLAGLAASQLHILEGISGTGKTSLPIAFAKAVGAAYEIVEVQAAWRDRLDLVGSYNAFDRRYYPTDFARALYRASTPGWSDTLNLIVMDEMNLAHPEHYFADVLSAMESGKRTIEIFPRSMGSAEALIDRRGIRFGPNVWFVGTANRDETTATIADKTYDRAHIMELPDRRARFERDSSALGADDGAIKSSQLTALFGMAARDHAREAAAVREVAEHAELRRASAALRIGFGNRLDRLVERLVPVVVAGGGTRVEALDHVLATKLVRKLEARYEVSEERFGALRAALEAASGVELDQLPRTNAELARQQDRLNA